MKKVYLVQGCDVYGNYYAFGVFCRPKDAKKAVSKALNMRVRWKKRAISEWEADRFTVDRFCWNSDYWAVDKIPGFAWLAIDEFRMDYFYSDDMRNVVRYLSGLSGKD